MRFLTFLTAIAIAVSSYAGELRRGDLLLSSSTQDPDRGYVSTGNYLDHHNELGAYLDTPASFPTDFYEPGAVLFEGRTRIVADRWHGLRRLNPDGSVGEAFGPELRDTAGVTMDREGHLYVVGSTGDEPRHLIEIDPNGTILREYPLYGAYTAIDLASDQCTLFYGRSDQRWIGGDELRVDYFISRFDVCTGTPIDDFMTLSSWPSELRVVRDGILVVFPLTNTLEHIGFDGRILHAYSGDQLFRIALDPSGDTFWAGQGRFMWHFRLDEMKPFDMSATSGGHTIHALAVVNGWRASRTETESHRPRGVVYH